MPSADETLLPNVEDTVSDQIANVTEPPSDSDALAEPESADASALVETQIGGVPEEAATEPQVCTSALHLTLYFLSPAFCLSFVIFLTFVSIPYRIYRMNQSQKRKAPLWKKTPLRRTPLRKISLQRIPLRKRTRPRASWTRHPRSLQI